MSHFHEHAPAILIPEMPQDAHNARLEAAYSAARPFILTEMKQSPHFAKVSENLRLTRLTPAVHNELSDSWNDLALKGHSHLKSPEVTFYANRCFKRCDNTGKVIVPEYYDEDRFEAALWMGSRLCAFSKGSPVIDSVLHVSAIAGRPETHELKGHVFCAIHHVARAYARLSGARQIGYIGPLSAGSMLQIERGALSIDEEQHARMWKGFSIEVPINENELTRHERYVHGTSRPPRIISGQNEGAYKRAFGKPYTPE